MSETPEHEPKPKSGLTKAAETLGHLNPDHSLAFLQGLVNSTDLSIGVTLSTNGGIVSGQMVSGRRWFTDLAGAARGAAGSETVAGALAEAFDSFAGDYPEPGAEDEAETLVTYVHLSGAVVVQGNTRLNLKLWRGRLVEVSGWSLGALELQED